MGGHSSPLSLLKSYSAAPPIFKIKLKQKESNILGLADFIFLHNLSS